MSTRARPRERREVLVDTSGYYSLVSARDANHAEARAIWTRLTRERWTPFTTNFVVAEAHALFLVRLGHYFATSFLREITSSSTTIVRVTSEDEENAREIIYQYDGHDFSYTDALSFAVMERLGLDSVFAFDRHFEAYGLTVLRA